MRPKPTILVAVPIANDNFTRCALSRLFSRIFFNILYIYHIPVFKQKIL